MSSYSILQVIKPLWQDMNSRKDLIMNQMREMFQIKMAHFFRLLSSTNKQKYKADDESYMT